MFNNLFLRAKNYISFLVINLSLLFRFLVFASNPPLLETPSSGSVLNDLSPTLKWNWSENCFVGGSCFRVQIDDQSNFDSPEKDYYTSNTSYTPKLSVATWYWRVKAKDINGFWSDWSSVWNFTITDEQISPNPSFFPTFTPFLTENPISTEKPTKAIYKINEVKDKDNNILSNVKIYVDGVYLHHYAPQIITFCGGCKCDTYVDCDFGFHTITLEKNGFERWIQTKIINSGDTYEVNPVMNPLTSSPSLVEQTNIPKSTQSLISATFFSPKMLTTELPLVLGKELIINSSESSLVGLKNKKLATESNSFFGNTATSSVSLKVLSKILFILGFLAILGMIISAFLVEKKKQKIF